MPFSPPTMLVISVTDGRGSNNPLHVVLRDSPYVTASYTLAQGYYDPNVHYVTFNSTGTDVHYFSANNNTYHVAIDSNNNIKPLPESEIPNADMYTFREEATDDAQQVRYYLQIGRDKYYLMAASNGNIVALNADDLALGSQNDTQSRFTILYV